MTALDVLEENKAAVSEIAARYGAYNIRVFGSVARGEANAESDIDLLVDMEPDRSLFDLGMLKEDLEELLGRRVDVLTEEGLYRFVKSGILKDARPL